MDSYAQEPSGVGLATLYKANQAVLMLNDKCCYRFQFIPGRLKSEAQQQQDLLRDNNSSKIPSCTTVERAAATTTAAMDVDGGIKKTEQEDNADDSRRSGPQLRLPDAHALPSQLVTEFSRQSANL